jgi:hypothetical protein
MIQHEDNRSIRWNPLAPLQFDTRVEQMEQPQDCKTDEVVEHGEPHVVLEYRRSGRFG